MHTYIHNWSLQPSVRNIDLVSHTAYVVCVNFVHKWRDLQFKVDSERQIFWETFSLQVFIYSQSVCPKSAKKKSPKKYFSYFVIMSGLGLDPRLFVYLLDHGDCGYVSKQNCRFLWFKIPTWSYRSQCTHYQGLFGATCGVEALSAPIFLKMGTAQPLHSMYLYVKTHNEVDNRYKCSTL